MTSLMDFNVNFFWIIVFAIQIIILYKLSNSFHTKLHLLGSEISKNRLFIAKIVGAIFFIGTLVHELSHIIMARLLFVRTKNINLKTEIIDDKHIKYGSAEVEVSDPFRNSLIGVAPLLFGVTLIYLLTIGINLNSLTLIDLIKVFLVSQISNSMFLSDSDTKDFKIVIIVVAIILAVTLLINENYVFLKFELITKNVENLFFNSNMVYFLKNINLIFFITLMLNFFSIIILNLFLKIKRY